MTGHEPKASADPPAHGSGRRSCRQVVTSLELILLGLALVVSLCDGMIYRFFGLQLRLATSLGVVLVLAQLWLVRVGLLAESRRALKSQMQVVGMVLALAVGAHLLDIGYLHLTQRAPDVEWTGDIPREEFKPVGSELRYPGANLILISIDTLRADHLGCYGYREDTSPNIDEFARTALQFTRAYAPTAATLPSHATMFTSLQPGAHQAEVERSIPLPREVTTLAEVLRDAGYRTAAVVDGGQLSPAWGLDQGFESYEVRQMEGFRSILPLALDKLKQLEDEKFFLFVHTYDVHTPYTPTQEDMQRFFHNYRGGLRTPIGDPVAVGLSRRELPADSNDIRFVEAAYDAGISWTDGQVGRLLAGISELGLDANTIVVITSDHGEAFGEHEWVALHLYSLFEELLHVPLVVRLPDRALAGSAFDYNVGLVDLMPTVLELLMVPYEGPMQGSSVTPMLAGREPLGDHQLFAQSFRYRDEHPDQRSYRRGVYKFVQDSLSWEDRLSSAIGRTKAFYTLRGRALYRTQNDYDESRNALLVDYRALGSMRVAQWLEDQMYRVVRESRALRVPAPEPVKLSPEEREQLRGLGYVQPGSAQKQE